MIFWLRSIGSRLQSTVFGNTRVSSLKPTSPSLCPLRSIGEHPSDQMFGPGAVTGFRGMKAIGGKAGLRVGDRQPWRRHGAALETEALAHAVHCGSADFEYLAEQRRHGRRTG